ncbi:MAG TPA: efflux RND transporter periplasmic adaptor subunit [Thermoanaerobaculia bacterium]|nr:efflux RND transporter periplasmic adaptor subunit [Thermoanaerobaculia bacterium]HQR65979.1 efflux RND transporter periplasmic adaptor subunit [Thermoanaerobaculia bacterium]
MPRSIMPGPVPAASWPLALLSVLVLGAGGCGKKPPAAAPPAPAVTVVTVAPKDEPVSSEFVGQTQSSHLVNIQARVSGFLDKRMYTEGAVVKEGQVLFQMDPKPFQAQLSQAKAALAQAEAAKETARLNLERTRPLTELNALSQKDLDDATGQYQSAAAAVEQARAEVETAQLNLSYTTITSPITGVSSSARQTDGTFINFQNSLLTTVATLSPMWVNFSLSENQMQSYRDQVERGLILLPKDKIYTLEIVLVDGSVYPHTAQITFAEPSFNAATGTFLIRGSVANPDGVLRPNQYVRVRVKGAVRPKAILIPQRAVHQGSQGHFVWVVRADGTAERRPVVVGDWNGDDWFVTEGLRAGDRVVVDGGLTLRPDLAVKVTEASSKGPEAARPASPAPSSGR